MTVRPLHPSPSGESGNRPSPRGNPVHARARGPGESGSRPLPRGNPVHAPARGAVLGVDPGTVRVGLAKSDPDRRVALPLRTVAAGEGLAARLAGIAREEGCSVVVVGLPRALAGHDTPSTTAARELARELAGEGIEVALADERLTSVQAEHALGGARGGPNGETSRRHDRGQRRKGAARGRSAAATRQERAAGSRDAAAAAILLQAWLDSRPHPR